VSKFGKRITLDDRIVIEVMNNRGEKASAISKVIDIHPDTIRKEIHKNSVKGVYNGVIAQQILQKRLIKAQEKTALKRNLDYLPTTKIGKLERRLIEIEEKLEIQGMHIQILTDQLKEKK
jgi:IS30 family transposase